MNHPTHSFVRYTGRAAQVVGYVNRNQFNPATRKQEQVRLMTIRFVGANDPAAGHSAEVNPSLCVTAEPLTAGAVYA